MRLNYIDNCDCLDGLREIPDKSVDLIVTDPPYGIGLKSQGAKTSKLNPWADICNGSLWYTAWIKESARILKNDGALWCFINWRYLPTIMKAGLDCGWSISSLLVWDKGWNGPGMKYLRPRYEFVALFAGPDFEIKDRTVSDIKEVKWCATKPTGHPAEKPEELIRWLLEISGKGEGAVVLDPFMGSGTTGAAAVKAGAQYIGYEMDSDWVIKGQQRIADALAEAADAMLDEEEIKLPPF